MTKKVFIESNVFMAFIDRGHPRHEEAAAYFRYFGEEQYFIYTHTHALIDVYNKIYTDISPSLAKDFLRTIALSHINVLYPEEQDFKGAIKALSAYPTTELTITKALSAVISYKRAIPQICTFEYMPTLFSLELFSLPL